MTQTGPSVGYDFDEKSASQIFSGKLNVVDKRGRESSSDKAHGSEVKGSTLEATPDRPHLRAALEQVHKLTLGQTFFVQDVQYQVVACGMDSITIRVVGFGPQTMKKIRRAIREDQK